MPRYRRRKGALTPGHLKARQTRRWLEHPTAGHLPLPTELKGRSRQAQSARAAWEEAHRAGERAAADAAAHGYTSPEATRGRVEARRAQDEMLLILGTTREELVADYSLRSGRGQNALALGRY